MSEKSHSEKIYPTQFEFFMNTRSWQPWQFCIASYENKFETKLILLKQRRVSLVYEDVFLT